MLEIGAASSLASKGPGVLFARGERALAGAGRAIPGAFPVGLAPPRPPAHAAFMGVPAMKPRRATYADLEAVPADKVAELIQGTLYVMPRPAPKHTTAASRLGFKIGGPFDLGERGPGGWRILIEPELRFPDPSKPGAFDALVPDLAGWRLERLPVLPSTAYFSLAPDWICEVLSTSTEEHDREVKMPVYAREGVRHAWLIDPVKRTLEVYTLGASGTWGGPVISRDVDVVRAPPFDAVGLDLSALWT